MILLIDAYNVLKQMSSSTMIGERERNKFIQELGRYAKKRQHKIILVFDGGPYERATQERKAGIYVVYAGTLESADDYIKRYFNEHSGHDILLISSDRELRSAAARYKFESMASHQFYKVLQDALLSGQDKSLKKTAATKTAKDKNVEFDQVIREGSKVVPQKVEDFVQQKRSRKSKSHRLSKKEQAYIKKIKKL